MSINVTRSSMPSYQEYCEEIKELWDSGEMDELHVKYGLSQWMYGIYTTTSAAMGKAQTQGGKIYEKTAPIGRFLH